MPRQSAAEGSRTAFVRELWSIAMTVVKQVAHLYVFVCRRSQSTVKKGTWQTTCRLWKDISQKSLSPSFSKAWWKQLAFATVTASFTGGASCSGSCLLSVCDVI